MQTIDPTLVQQNLAGIPIEGYVKGTYIEISYDTDAFSDEVGAQGEVVRVKSADKRGTAKFTLMESSPTNDLLSSLAVIDRQSPGGLGVGAYLMEDLASTATVARSQNAWIKKIPTTKKATEMQAIEWEIRLAQLELFIGSTLEL